MMSPLRNAVFSIALLAVVLASRKSAASAFTGTSRHNSVRSAPVPLDATRRQLLETTMSGSVVATFLLTIPSSVVRASADVDYSKIQDLLGVDQANAPTTPNDGSSGRRPMYLTEPTQDFRDNEAKASDFRRQQIQKKVKFQEQVEKVTVSMEPTPLLDALDSMRNMVKSQGGLPEGIQKEALFKSIRARKRKKNWPTEVEVAYQDLINEILYQQSPNTDREKEGFL